MKKTFKRVLGAVLGGTMAMSLLAGCGGGGGVGGDADETYTMWIYSGQDAAYYLDYEENPALQYALQKTYGPDEKTLAIDFWVPPSGSAADNYSTMIGSGDLPDVIDASIADAPTVMYETGMIMDLTELIPEYMPNYMKYLEEHPEIAHKAYVDIDGEEKMLFIRSFEEDYGYNFCGVEYRRDWLARYGTNPETGAAFTGEFTDESDPDSWVDDVVFPSGGSDPIYISDWEWMFEIFDKAMEAEGITDGYCLSIYYPGFTWNGNFTSCFGGGSPLWYEDLDGNVTFGADSPQFRAYLECLNTWYSKGWIDQSFNQRTSDAHYSIDDTTTRQGKVGLWVGLESQLGGRMDVGASEYTEGICSYGAPWPINDVYGDASCQNVEPNAVDHTSLAGTVWYVTSAAEGKDLGTLLSFFDYFYTEEGAVLKTLGLSKEQVEETQNQVYLDNGLENGAYSVKEDGTYLLDEMLQKDSGGLAKAAAFTMVPGITLVSSVDKGYAENYEHSMSLWTLYPNTTFFQGSDVTGYMTEADTKSVTNIQSKILDYMTVNAPNFIMGKTDPYDDGDWNDWCTMLGKYGYTKVNDVVQPYADKYEID